jgi:hypothetical protein
MLNRLIATGLSDNTHIFHIYSMNDLLVKMVAVQLGGNPDQSVIQTKHSFQVSFALLPSNVRVPQFVRPEVCASCCYGSLVKPVKKKD